ncbi:chromosome replication/partitioning protein (plasmid) [Borrelia puertoricensis]|uniref:chromosome replication/partitioning protein n=1 Tax=Borrelia puertoricensis TaxID=2756107 RepID=UPI001FF25109|nr:chromosome replication/partitioning protein [Borrelia puertoricensis]UPA19287.1 chromosome replication/partitioning protein [Borrelia puertoricensis]
MQIQVNDRVLKKIDSEEELRIYYNRLKENFINSFKKEIVYKIECMKILKEIKDNEYYKMDGFKTFDSFTKNFKIARSQIYNYLKLAGAMENGLISEEYLLENGINDSLDLIKNKERSTLKTSKQNPIKPLKFQLKKQESYDFYKQDSKFIAFFLDEIFSNQKDLLDKLLKKFKDLKNE